MKFDPSQMSRTEAYFLMISCIVPRPIAFISSISESGVTNAAPFSFFNGINGKPPLLVVAIGRREGVKKDSLQNIEATGEFVVNIPDENIAPKMVQCSADYPPDISEIETVGLTTLPSELIRPPRLAECAIQMECKLRQTVEIHDSITTLIIAEVLLYHIRDDILDGGVVDPQKLKPVGRLGGRTYAKTPEYFTLAPESI
ncbi:flavin reductase family protein [Planctomycetota bacterium]